MATSRRKYKDGIYHDEQGRLIERRGKSCKLYWSKSMLDYLKANYPTTTNDELSEYFGISARVISNKANELGLAKNKGWLLAINRRNIATATLHNRVYGNKGMFKKGHVNRNGFQRGHECQQEWEAKRLAGLMEFYKNPVKAKAKAYKGWETRRRKQLVAKLRAKEVAV